MSNENKYDLEYAKLNLEYMKFEEQLRKEHEKKIKGIKRKRMIVNLTASLLIIVVWSFILNAYILKDNNLKIVDDHKLKQTKIEYKYPDYKPIDAYWSEQNYKEKEQAEKKLEKERIKKKVKVSKVSNSNNNLEAPSDVVANDNDLLLLAKLIHAEAKGEPYNGKVAVGNVVLNRVDSNKFPDTIKGVIYQRGQFSPVSNGSINNDPSSEAIRAASEAFNKKVIGKHVLYFYSPQLSRDEWIRTREVATKIGSHIFAR